MKGQTGSTARLHEVLEEDGDLAELARAKKADEAQEAQEAEEHQLS